MESKAFTARVNTRRKVSEFGAGQFWKGFGRFAHFHKGHLQKRKAEFYKVENDAGCKSLMLQLSRLIYDMNGIMCIWTIYTLNNSSLNQFAYISVDCNFILPLYANEISKSKPGMGETRVEWPLKRGLRKRSASNRQIRVCSGNWQGFKSLELSL